MYVLYLHCAGKFINSPAKSRVMAVRARVVGGLAAVIRLGGDCAAE